MKYAIVIIALVAVTTYTFGLGSLSASRSDQFGLQVPVAPISKEAARPTSDHGLLPTTAAVELKQNAAAAESADDSTLPGLVVPDQHCWVRAATAGVLTEHAVVVGDLAEAGQVLVRVDDRQVRASIRAQQLRLQAIAKLMRAAQVQFETARADYERKAAANRRQRGVVVESTLFRCRQQAKTANLEIERLRVEGRALQQEIRAAQAGLDHYRAVAPIDGTIVEVVAAAGQYVEAGENLARIDSHVSLVKVQVDAGGERVSGNPQFSLVRVGSDEVPLSIHRWGDYNPDGTRDLYLRAEQSAQLRANEIVAVRIDG